MDDLIPDIAVYGGPGRDSLTVNDTAHTSASETANQYTVSDTPGVGSIARTYNWQIGTTIHHLGDSITYTGLSGGVFLDTDNVGTPVDVEGTLASIPTTVNLGTANTTVTVAAAGQSLAAFGSALTLNGGTGTDSLVVDDQKDPYASATPYLVNSGLIDRTLPVSPYAAFVSYQGFTGSVTLNTDNNGTPVDVEGTSAPTTVNVGSGNTAVSVTASGKNLGLLASYLTVNGGSGSDSLTVNDSLNPLAATSGARHVDLVLVYGIEPVRRADDLHQHPLPADAAHPLHQLHEHETAGSRSTPIITAHPVDVAGSPGPDPVTIDGGTGTNTLNGPAVATSWSLTGANAGSLGGWVNFTGFASLAGGSAANSFDFSTGGSLSGSIAGGTGPNLLNYARESTGVTVNLATGAATGVAGGVTNIQGVVGSTGPTR